jgi:hypothetical protein
LHSERKSWAAVIVPEDAAESIGTALNVFLAGVASDYGAKELHFTDIYAGRGVFKGTSISERYQLIDLMAGIFEKFQLPIFFQTSSPEFYAEIQPRLSPALRDSPRIGLFDVRRHDHFALLYLLFQIERFMLEYKQHFRNPLPVTIDEGIAKAGVAVEFPGWTHCFQGGRVEFCRSHECPFLQLADFAAFAIARVQWLSGRGNLKPHDIEFLRMTSAGRLYIMNLARVPVVPETHTTAAYDQFLKRDRLAKGLPETPPSSR